MLLTLLDSLHRALRVAVMLAFAALLLAVLLQVSARLAPGVQSPIWTEEFSRFCLIFAAALGAGLALRSGELVGVDIITANLPVRGKLVFEFLTMLTIVAFSAVLIAPAWDYVDIGSLQTSPALQWNMFYVHMAVLIAPITLALAAIERALRIVLADWKAA
jgi:TRAP-type C4-dicarboxylate transport system permease small subunit